MDVTCGLLILFIINSVCGQIEYHEGVIPWYTPNNTEGMGEALFLTPYIQSSDIETALDLAFVRHPRMEHLTSYSGFLTVDERYNSNLFFWFFKAQKNWKEAPVILWLQGGPGGSDFYGMFYLNGPFYLTAELDFPPREHSWHIDHNIIFIDNPVGTGYSFTDNEDGYATTETDVAEDLYEFMQQFFVLFPNLRSNDFFICAESYGAHYAVNFAPLIYERNLDVPDDRFINLQGVAIGNGAVDMTNRLFNPDVFHQLGFMDEDTTKTLRSSIQYLKSLVEKGEFERAQLEGTLLFWTSNSMIVETTGLEQTFNYFTTGLQEADLTDQMLAFLKDVAVRKAIHVGGRAFSGLVGSLAAKYLGATVPLSIAEKISEVLSYYPLLLYNGQIDLETHITSLEDFLWDMDFKDHDLYVTAPRQVWRVDREIAGYVKKAGHLTEVMVRNAGHMVPLDQPKWCLDLIKHFTFKKSFEEN
ncbi:hypothetical protein DMENIID0001_041720 [Sergentomyia squamirostris]